MGAAIIPSAFGGAPAVTTASPGMTPWGGGYARVDPVTGAFSFYTLAVPADTLNRAATSNAELQASVVGSGSVVPIIYGRFRVGPLIAGVCVYNGSLVIRAIWSIGEIQGVSAVYINDVAMGSGVTATHYTGTATQAVDATLVAAYAANGQVYTDALPGIAYSVFVFAAGSVSGFPRITANVQGLKVRSSSGGSRAWSYNPAYVIADFIESTTYGMGRQVDWDSVATLATFCNVTIGGTERRRLDIVMAQQQPCETWLNIMRDTAGCWIVPEGPKYRLVVDTTGASVKSFTSSNIVARSLKLAKRGTSQTPTCLEVTYTDNSQIPWRDGKCTIYAPGVLEGTTPRRMSRIAKSDLRPYTRAYRYAVERLNESILNDLTVTFQAFDEALAVQVGDLIDVTHPIGLSAKVFRVLKIEPVGGGGRWNITGIEYDAAKYCDDVVTDPTVADTVLPSPLSPPTVTGLTVAEDVYQDATGLYGSRLAISWTAASTYPFVSGYVVTVSQGSTLKETATVTSGTSYLTKPLTEGVLYTVSVQVLSTLDVKGTAATATITNTGKAAKPTDVPSITGFEVGGEVRLNWTPATDLDLTAHEIRYSTTGGSWAAATLLDRVAAPAVRYTTRAVAAGTWRFWIKGLDSVRSATYPYGQESNNAAYVDIVVTSDANAFLAGNYSFATASLTNMSAVRLGDNTTYWVSDDGVTWSTAFSSTLSTYTNAVFTYFATATATLETDHKDFGASITGSWTGGVAYTNLSGSASSYLDLSTVDSGYTGYSTLPTSQTARWAKNRITSTGALLVTGLGEARVTTVGRSETGSVTTSASGAATVTLTGKYVKAVSIQLTPASGGTARMAAYDNVVVGTGTNSFDAYCFDTAGSKVAQACTYTFSGV